ncbi:uncharacterized protein BROUX77_006100 [Berkeleyomyces rouxiae]|uniref:uncharacterized protein n=1 Tax=Berkeleyomyces rouxiae TaxID=2035830 RepID=UPI003B7CC68B
MTAFSYLRDGALDWAMPRMDPATGHMNFETYDDFMKSLAEAFDDPDWRMTATQQIFDLKQTGTCTAYHSAFTTLLKKLGWADADFTIALFQRGLKPHIQDALAWNTYPAPKGTLDQFANFCNTLDNTINNRTEPVAVVQWYSTWQGFSVGYREVVGSIPTSDANFLRAVNLNWVAVVQWYSTWQGFSVGYREVVGSIPTSDANFLRAVNLNWGTWG